MNKCNPNIKKLQKYKYFQGNSDYANSWLLEGLLFVKELIYAVLFLIFAYILHIPLILLVIFTIIDIISLCYVGFKYL